MKFLKNPKDAITFLLVALLVVSCFWIVKSELKAASLQSRLDEHHKQLQNDSDVLENLSSFIRKINNNGITIDGNKILIAAGQSVVKLENNKISIETPGEIQIGNSSDINFGYDKKSDALYMKNKGVSMHMGKLNDDKGKFLDYGTFFRTNSGVQFTIRDEGISCWVPSDNGYYSFKLAAKKKYVELKKDNSIIRFEGDSINIEAQDNITIKISDDIKFGYDKKSNALYMKNKGVSMHMGKLNDDNGKFLDYGTFFRTNSGVQFTIRDEGISGWVPSNNGSYSFKLAAKKKYVELKKDNSIIRFEGDDISIEAPGDINITSKNGKVNINGKR